jgi:hypothetical protein
MASLSESTTRICRWSLRDSVNDWCQPVSWGQVLGTGSRLLGESQGASRKRCVDERTSRIAGKAPSQALFRHPIATVESAHASPSARRRHGRTGQGHAEADRRARRRPLGSARGRDGVASRPPSNALLVTAPERVRERLGRSRALRLAQAAGRLRSAPDVRAGGLRRLAVASNNSRRSWPRSSAASPRSCRARAPFAHGAWRRTHLRRAVARLERRPQADGQ